MSSAFLDTVLGPETEPTSVVCRSMKAIGTTATIGVTRGGRADQALTLLAEDLSALDKACSRFRTDSELSHLEQRCMGKPVPVSPLLFDAIEVACVVAVKTAGIVDPTIGSALIELGYDRDFDEMATGDHPPGPRLYPLRGGGGSLSIPRPGRWPSRPGSTSIWGQRPRRWWPTGPPNESPRRSTAESW